MVSATETKQEASVAKDEKKESSASLLQVILLFAVCFNLIFGVGFQQC